MGSFAVVMTTRDGLPWAILSEMRLAIGVCAVLNALVGQCPAVNGVAKR